MIQELRYRTSTLPTRLALLFLTIVTQGCSAPPDLPESRDAQIPADEDEDQIRGETMGTTYHLRLAAAVDAATRARLQKLIEREFDAVNQSMSNYLRDSELSRLNGRPAGEEVKVSAPLLEVLAEAKRIHALTDGAFDITVGPLVRRWGFGPGAEPAPTPPTEEETETLLRRIGLRHLSVSIDSGSVTKKIDGLELDLSGIAKGYAVDRAASALEAAGYQDFMMEVGGELSTRGLNRSGDAWRIAIEEANPESRAVHRIVPLSGLSMASSGDYRNFYQIDGEGFSHLMDPRLGRPVNHLLASVTVIDERCIAADALASGLLVLGPDHGWELAQRLEIAALFQIRRTNDEREGRMTDAFRTLLVSALIPGKR